MAAIKISPFKWIGASTDTKPTEATNSSVREGATFYEYDTRNTYITYDGTNWLIKNTIADIQPFEIRVDKAIEAGLGAYAAGDVVGNESCCTTTATYWTFEDVAREDGGYFTIVGATLFNETENQAVQYDFHLLNAPPTGEVKDNAANTNPIKGDKLKYLDKIAFPSTSADGSTVASHIIVTPSTVGNIPMRHKCASSSRAIYGVLVTNTVYTQTAGDIIEITLQVEQH